MTPGGRRRRPEEDRGRLFDEVTERVVATAASGLLIALDDLHAADEGSLQLLRFLVRADAAGTAAAGGHLPPQRGGPVAVPSDGAQRGRPVRADHPLAGSRPRGVGVLLDRAGAAVNRARPTTSTA